MCYAKKKKKEEKKHPNPQNPKCDNVYFDLYFQMTVPFVYFSVARINLSCYVSFTNNERIVKTNAVFIFAGCMLQINI